jgi:hypothetical protein
MLGKPSYIIILSIDIYIYLDLVTAIESTQAAKMSKKAVSNILGVVSKLSFTPGHTQALSSSACSMAKRFTSP